MQQLVTAAKYLQVPDTEWTPKGGQPEAYYHHRPQQAAAQDRRANVIPAAFT